MLVAITREIDESICSCELTYVERMPIDVVCARVQHRDYESRLADLGCQILRLPAAPGMADAVFIEDTCVVFPELAVVTRPGSPHRQAETDAVAAAMAPYRPVHVLESPVTLDGGDVLVLGRNVFVGLSRRTNAASLDALKAILVPFDYTVTPVAIWDCLHLKTAVSQVASETLLLNRSWIDPSVFGDWAIMDVDPAEPFAANGLRIGETLVYPRAFPRTQARLELAGIRVATVDISELAKAEAGVTCCSLVFDSA